MEGLIVGIILMIVGVVLIVAGSKRNKKVTVLASNGSMAVGGDNSGVMLNIAPSAAEHKSHGHGLTIFGVIVELIAIGVTIWSTLQMVA